MVYIFIGKSKVEYELEILRLRKNIEGESIRVVENVINPSL
jgi:hypothetical protein